MAAVALALMALMLGLVISVSIAVKSAPACERTHTWDRWQHEDVVVTYCSECGMLPGRQERIAPEVLKALKLQKEQEKYLKN